MGVGVSKERVNATTPTIDLLLTSFICGTTLPSLDRFHGYLQTGETEHHS
jgi:hypothetical protein